MFADSRYAHIEKKCGSADIADADINIGTSLVCTPSHTTRDIDLMFVEFPFRVEVGGPTKLVNDFLFLDIELCTWPLNYVVT